MTTSTTIDDDYTLLNRRLDGDSSYWKKKYSTLMKKTENIETVNLCNIYYHLLFIKTPVAYHFLQYPITPIF